MPPAMRIAISSPQNASCSVGHSASPISGSTGVPVRVLVPQSPITKHAAARGSTARAPSDQDPAARPRAASAVGSCAWRSFASGSKVARTAQKSMKEATRITGSEYSTRRVMN